MALEIPGYFFDEGKKKYFKIEKSQTAGSSATWSSDAVKRRKIEEADKDAARRRERLLKNHIRRRPGVWGDAVSCVLLDRETAGGLVTRPRPNSIWDSTDVGSAAWAEGLVYKSEVPFASMLYAANRQRQGRRREDRPAGGLPNVSCLYVGGDDDKTGLGVAYTTLDEETLVGSYVPTDADGKICFTDDAPADSGRNLSFRTEMTRCPQMSSITYHSYSHKILLTSREPDHSCGLYFFSPPKSSEEDAEDKRPLWLLGETNHYQRLSIRHRLRDEWVVHRATPAPASSPDSLCIIGTNAGVLRVRRNETMAWIAPQEQTGDGGPGAGAPAKGFALPREIFDQDFCVGNPHLLFAGGRQHRLWMTDLRTPDVDWTFAAHKSSIARLRSVSDNHVLVSGLRSSMCVYDLRFLGRGGTRSSSTNFRSGHSTLASPVLTFPTHRNEAHVHVGWDVSTELGVVAAAQEDGAVALFSMRSGRRLHAPALSAIPSGNGRPPIRALQFQRMPHERSPSLFVGEGPSVTKYSFGTLDVDEM